jgi:DNA invertase Pin-like site-specific DNA recombinase
MTDYEKEIISYRKQGKTYKEIKQILKISKSTISYYCTKNKLNILFESTKPSNIEEIILFKNEYHTAKDTIDKFKLSRYTYYKYIHPLVQKNVSFNKKKKKRIKCFLLFKLWKRNIIFI